MTRYTPSEIKTERLKRKWTQREFADMIGVTPVAVSKWENDQSEPSYNHMNRIREIFTRGAPDPDRLAGLEREISQLRGEQQRLLERVQLLTLDADEYRAEVLARFERLATLVAGVAVEAPPSAPEAER